MGVLGQWPGVVGDGRSQVTEVCYVPASRVSLLSLSSLLKHGWTVDMCKGAEQ
jgi:hypothetical protein